MKKLFLLINMIFFISCTSTQIKLKSFPKLTKGEDMNNGEADIVVSNTKSKNRNLSSWRNAKILFNNSRDTITLGYLEKNKPLILEEHEAVLVQELIDIFGFKTKRDFFYSFSKKYNMFQHDLYIYSIYPKKESKGETK